MCEHGECPHCPRHTSFLTALVWTPAEMAAVLAVVTHYPLRGRTPGYGEDLVRQLGGSHAVRHLLRACQKRLPPASRWVLAGFLGGGTRAQVVAEVSAQAPLHPAWVYKVIQALPATLLPSFVAHLDPGDAGPPASVPALLHTLHTCRDRFGAGEVEPLAHLAYIEQLVMREYRGG